jgi:protein SCO1/2
MRRREFALACLALTGCNKKAPLPELGSIPPFEFTNEQGKTFGSADLKGKLWVADFFFTNCPGPCPRMSNQLERVQRETLHLPHVHLVSITVDPDRDTAAALNQYAKRFKALPERWTFLTGRKDLIRNLMSESFYLGYADSMQEHSTRFVLVDGNMKIRGFYDSFANDGIDKLIEDIRLLHDNS